jgi:hypothetical protein
VPLNVNQLLPNVTLTLEVRSSSLLVPTIYFVESALSRAAVSPRVDPTRHHWSPNPRDFLVTKSARFSTAFRCAAGIEMV